MDKEARKRQLIEDRSDLVRDKLRADLLDKTFQLALGEMCALHGVLYTREYLLKHAQHLEEFG